MSSPQVPQDLELAVGKAMASVLRDPNGKGRLFVKLYYKMLQFNMAGGRESILHALWAIAKSAGVRK